MQIKRNISWSAKKFSVITKIAIATIAYVYIFYKIRNDFQHIEPPAYSSLFIYPEILPLLAVILLMPLNWYLESLKWQKLIHSFEQISTWLSIKTVLFGLSCSIFTPYRLGEFAGRPLMVPAPHRMKALLATGIGSFAQGAVTVFMAGIGLLFYLMGNTTHWPFISDNSMLFLISVAACFSAIILIYFIPGKIFQLIGRIKPAKRVQNMIEFLKTYEFKELSVILILSILRYTIFFFQYFLLLKIFGVSISIIHAFCAISLSYLFLFSIPGIPVAEPGIRGSLAFIFIGSFSPEYTGILLSSTSLWFINLAFPALLGSSLVMKHSIKKLQTVSNEIVDNKLQYFN